MPRYEVADLSKSLDELQGFESGDEEAAPTTLVRDIILARKKPLAALTRPEIGCLIVQMDGVPFILDLVFPLLDADPLVDGGYYPGDILSNLIRADEDTWRDRPVYQERLNGLYQRALARPADEKDAFLDSLGIENDRNPN